MLQNEGILDHKNWRYLKSSGVLVLVTGVLTAISAVLGARHFGGHWLVYLLGIVSALLSIWLLWYVVAKRYVPRIVDRRAATGRRREIDAQDMTKGSPAKTGDDERRRRSAKQTLRFGGTLQGWLSAHVYFGLAVLFVASFHSGLHFGWNIHTLTYVLLLLAVVSGIYGIYVYLNYPRMITLNMGGDTLPDLLRRIAELDEMARLRALSLPNEINQMVYKARTRTRLGGGLISLLTGSSDLNCPTREAAANVLQLAPKYLDGDQPKLMRDLYLVLQRKERLLRRARLDIKLNAQMQFWMYIHGPVSVALLGALAIHVFSVLFYW